MSSGSRYSETDKAVTGWAAFRPPWCHGHEVDGAEWLAAAELGGGVAELTIPPGLVLHSAVDSIARIQLPLGG